MIVTTIFLFLLIVGLYVAASVKYDEIDRRLDRLEEVLKVDKLEEMPGVRDKREKGGMV